MQYCVIILGVEYHMTTMVVFTVVPLIKEHFQLYYKGETKLGKFIFKQQLHLKLCDIS